MDWPPKLEGFGGEAFPQQPPAAQHLHVTWSKSHCGPGRAFFWGSWERSSLHPTIVLLPPETVAFTPQHTDIKCIMASSAAFLFFAIVSHPPSFFIISNIFFFSISPLSCVHEIFFPPVSPARYSYIISLWWVNVSN